MDAATAVLTRPPIAPLRPSAAPASVWVPRPVSEMTDAEYDAWSNFYSAAATRAR